MISPLSLTSSKRTRTRFETPDSCIVTPYSVPAQVIIFLECVTTMNWVHLQEFPEHADETLDVRLVQCRIDFVEDAKWAGTAAEDCQQQGDTSQSFLTAAQQ